MQLPAPRSQERIWEQVQAAFTLRYSCDFGARSSPFMDDVSSTRLRVSHTLEIDSPADQLQQYNQRRPRHRFSPQIRNVLRRVDFRWLYSEMDQTVAHPGDINRLRLAHVLECATVPRDRN